MVLRRLARLPMPTIAAIDGPALGGGLELALACDLRVSRDGRALGLPESRLGGLAGSGSVRLTRLVGPARAKEMLFTGETISAEQALAWGLVNRVVDGGLGARRSARASPTTIARRGPLSNRLAKELVDAAQDVALDAALSLSTVAQQEIFDARPARRRRRLPRQTDAGVPGAMRSSRGSRPRSEFQVRPAPFMARLPAKRCLSINRAPRAGRGRVASRRDHRAPRPSQERGAPALRDVDRAGMGREGTADELMSARCRPRI